LHDWFNSTIVWVWAAEIFTVRRVASPLLDLGSWIHATVDMNGTVTNDAVCFVEGDNFTLHLLLSFFLEVATVTAGPTATTLFTQDAVQLAALVALLVIFEEVSHHFLCRFRNPPKRPFFFGCVMWMTRIASLAKP
jgi:hypothetical protein